MLILKNNCSSSSAETATTNTGKEKSNWAVLSPKCSAQTRLEEPDFERAHLTLHKYRRNPNIHNMHLTGVRLKYRRGHQLQSNWILILFRATELWIWKRNHLFIRRFQKILVRPFIYSLLESKNADESVIVRDVIWFSLKGCTTTFRVSLPKGGSSF